MIKNLAHADNHSRREMMNEGLEHLQDRGFAQEMGFGDRPALLIVDLIDAFTNPTLALGSDASQEIEETNRLIRVARKASVPIFFSTIRYDEHDLADAGVWVRKIEGLRTLSFDSGGAEIDLRLERSEGDPVIVKKFASCFFGTSLSSTLKDANIDTLILVGCTTSGCVRATAVDSCQYGFRTIVAREAVLDRLPASHDQSLIDIQLKYGDVLSVDEIISKMNEIGS